MRRTCRPGSRFSSRPAPRDFRRRWTSPRPTRSTRGCAKALLARRPGLAQNRAFFRSIPHRTERSMKTRFILAALGAVALATPAVASLELAQKNACTACHSVDKKLVGPAYKDVAAKYKGDAKAE